MRSVIRRLTKAVRLLLRGNVGELRYRLWNKWKGVDFGFESTEHLALPPAHFHYSSGGPILARVFETIEIPSGSVALDLGSGKGGAALTLSRAGFVEVVGVELSERLVHVARSNAERLGRRNVRFIHGNAGAFQDYDRVTHIFMYNPFPCEVMTQVMANLRASLDRAPRPLTIVYRKPLCHDVILSSGLFEAGPEERHPPDPHPWRVYRRRR
ncbi:MAG TPA: class I SAM-dependent methyltransferase [Vicinamibacterales bacterium]